MLPSCIPRRLVSALLAAALSSRPAFPSLAAREPPAEGGREEKQRLERALYAGPAVERQTYAQQLDDAILLKSMRGAWTLREYSADGKLVSTGTLIFRGADSSPDKGQVSYEGEASRGRGPWILKSDGFGRSPVGKGGIIEMKALWKLRRGSEGTLVYSGRAAVTSFSGDRPNAVIKGPIVQLINGGKPKGGSEKKVGSFEAELTRFLTAAEEEASVDSAAAGGAPQELQVVCVASTSVRCK